MGQMRVIPSQIDSSTIDQSSFISLALCPRVHIGNSSSGPRVVGTDGNQLLLGNESKVVEI